MCIPQERIHGIVCVRRDLLHLRVSGRGHTKIEEVAPLHQGRSHDKFRFQAIGKYVSCLLRSSAVFENCVVRGLGALASNEPVEIPCGVLFEETGFDYRDFPSEFSVTVIAVPSRLLAERCWAVSYNFMSDAAVTNKLHRNIFMYQPLIGRHEFICRNLSDTPFPSLKIKREVTLEFRKQNGAGFYEVVHVRRYAREAEKVSPCSHVTGYNVSVRICESEIHLYRVTVFYEHDFLSDVFIHVV